MYLLLYKNEGCHVTIYGRYTQFSNWKVISRSIILYFTYIVFTFDVFSSIWEEKKNWKSHYFHNRTCYTTSPININWGEEMQHNCPLRNFTHQGSSAFMLAHFQIHAQAQIFQLSRMTAYWLTLSLDWRAKWWDPQTDMRSRGSSRGWLLFKYQLYRLSGCNKWMTRATGLANTPLDLANLY